MGVTQLWDLLEGIQSPHGQGSIVKKLYGNRGQQLDIVAEVEGKTVAVDLSLWIFNVGTGVMCHQCGAHFGRGALWPHSGAQLLPHLN